MADPTRDLAPPSAPTGMLLRLPRWLATTWVVAGVVGIVASLAGAVVGVVLVRDTTDASVQALALTDTVLAAVEDTAVVLDTTFTDVATALDTVQGSVGDATTTMGRVGTTLDDLTVLVTEDVPASLDAVNDAMPQLVRTAGVIDSALRALSFVGVDYAPGTPLDESLGTVQDRLTEIPPELRAQREGLEDVSGRLDDLAGQGEVVADDLATISEDLVASRDLLDDYRSTAREASTLVDDLTARLQSRSRTATWVIVVLAVAVALGQTVPIALGLQVLRAPRA